MERNKAEPTYGKTGSTYGKDKVLDKLIEIQVDIAEIRKDLNYHILRTGQNEEMIEIIAKEIKPIQEHVAFLKYSGKLITVLTAIAGVVVAYLQLNK